MVGLNESPKICEKYKDKKSNSDKIKDDYLGAELLNFEYYHSKAS